MPVADQALRQAEANLTNARAQFDRTRRLHQDGFLGRSALDEAQRNLDVSRTQVEAAHKQFESAKPAGSDYEVALRALEQARASLLVSQAKLAYTTITAPSDGTLIARDVERGDVVQPGKVLMVLSPAGETQIVLQIDERNLGRLKLGQPALASADAYPAQRFAAQLVYINPGVDAQRGTVEVKLLVAQPPEYLRQDMTVSVDIEVERSAAALTLPADTVRDGAGAAPWVLVVRNGRAHRQPVKLGLRGDTMVQVVEGVAEGDRVVPATNARVKPDQPVRIADA